MQASLETTAVDAALTSDSLPPPLEQTVVTVAAKPVETATEPPIQKSATYQEIVASCLGADPPFICAQLATGVTVDAATRNWMAEQNKRIEAAKQKPGVDAVGTKPGNTTSTINPDAIANWHALLDAKKIAGRTAAQAMRECVAESPEAHAAYLAAFNAGIDRE